MFDEPALASDFLSAIRAHTGNEIGPAGALARYLGLMGWSFSANGTLSLDGYLALSVQNDSLRDIRSTQHQSWGYYVQRQISHRKGTTDTPFDFAILQKLLQSMSVIELKQIAYDLTGGDQVAAVKSTWSTSVDANCPFCHQLNTHRHRQLDCPAFEFVRHRHPQAIA